MDNWITVEEAEKIADFDENYIRFLAREGKVTGKKFANTWMIDKDSILEYAEGKEARKHMPKNVKKEAQNVN